MGHSRFKDPRSYIDSLPGPTRATASAFADWVFWQTKGFKYFDPRSSPTRERRRALGKLDHRLIELFLQSKWIHEQFGQKADSDWSLYFVDSGEDCRQPFDASRLKFRGLTFRCIPDLVLRNLKTAEFMVIERKTSRRFMPSSGWPNIEAQLWCYSHMDVFADAPEVYLIAETWQPINAGYQRSNRNAIWRRSDAAFHQRCRLFFDEYGGTFLE
jgi:hypothetical protein